MEIKVSWLASKGKPALEFAAPSIGARDWLKNPARRGALVAQMFLRVWGIEVAFSHEGRAGTWVIRIQYEGGKYRHHRQHRQHRLR